MQLHHGYTAIDEGPCVAVQPSTNHHSEWWMMPHTLARQGGIHHPDAAMLPMCVCVCVEGAFDNLPMVPADHDTAENATTETSVGRDVRYDGLAPSDKKKEWQ
jgi:hypothetical protein